MNILQNLHNIMHAIIHLTRCYKGLCLVRDMIYLYIPIFNSISKIFKMLIWLYLNLFRNFHLKKVFSLSAYLINF